MAMVDVTRPTGLAALLLLAALAWPVFWPSSADAETAIHFTLDRKIDGPAAPFFLAIERATSGRRPQRTSTLPTAR
jgi:hypothetical protein